MTNNYTGYAERAIVTAESINYNIGEVIEIGIHFTSGDAVNAISEVGENYSGNFITVFKCDEVCGHKVDYTKLDELNEDEYDEEYAIELGKYGVSSGCNSEEEIIIENAKFEVISIEEEEFYGSKDEDGAPGIKIINVKFERNKNANA